MIRSSFQVLIFLLLSVAAIAQNNLYNSNNQVLMQNRYEKIEGSPYLLEGWTKGVLHPLKGEPIRQDKINFNGASGKFDIVESNVFIELNAALYNKVELMHNGMDYVFVNRVTENDLTYYRLLHEGDGYLFLEKFESDLKSQGANYGVSAEKEKFIPRTRHFIWKDGKLESINRSTKKILEYFDSAALKKEVQSKKLNLKEDADLSAALSYYDQRRAEKKAN